jgi:hypothetical protein
VEGSRCLPARCSCSPRVHAGAGGVSCLLRDYRTLAHDNTASHCCQSARVTASE